MPKDAEVENKANIGCPYCSQRKLPPPDKTDNVLCPSCGVRFLEYGGSRRDLPEFLPWFRFPLHQAFFYAVFNERQRDNKRVYREGAFGFKRGDLLYDTPKAYDAPVWSEAMKHLGYCIQIHYAEKEKARGRVQASLYKPDRERKRLVKSKEIHTTQEKFLQFLKNGNLELLHPEVPIAKGHI